MLRVNPAFMVTAIFLAAANIPAIARPEAAEQIRAVIRAQQEAWNRGDIDGFMTDKRAATASPARTRQRSFPKTP